MFPLLQARFLVSYITFAAAGWFPTSTPLADAPHALPDSILSSVALTDTLALGQPDVSDQYAQYLLAAANQERTARGLSPLSFDPTLAQAASFHALQMADHADISHEFPNEPDLSARGAQAGVHFSLITENVAEAPDAADIHTMWMNSEGHRDNLLDPEVNVVGIAVVARDGELYAVEDFADTVPSLSLDQQESSVASELSRTGITVSQQPGATIQDARQTCTMPTGFAGSRRPWFVLRYTASSLTQLPPMLTARITSGKYHSALVGACPATDTGSFSAYNLAVLLYP